jgi:hypothetical protein
MPVPSPRNKILPARGNHADLLANVASLLDGEMCYAIDQDQYYQKEGGVLVQVGGGGGAVDSVNTQTGVVVLDADDIDDTSTTHKFATAAQLTNADNAVQPGDNISALTNDAGYITAAGVPADAVSSVNTQTGAVVLDADDIDDTSTTNKFATAAQLTNADNAVQPTDSVSTLSDVNTSGVSNGDVLSYNGTAWVPASAPPADISGSSIGQLNDVNTTTSAPTNGQFLSWNSAAGEWVPTTGGGGGANLSYTASPANGVVASDSGTDATLTVADGTNAGLMAPADFTKLGGIASGATSVTDNSQIANSAGYLTDVVLDTTPQLGGNLDINGNYIVSTSGGNVELAPDTTGDVVIRGNTSDGSVTLNCTANTHGVKIQSPPHSDAATYTLTLPSTAGTSGQVLSSQAGAQLTWETPNWTEGTNQLYPANASSAVLIGGTLPSAPNITLDDAGSITATGTISNSERTITAGAFDLATGNHWTCGAITVPAPTNAVAGTSGLIRITAGPVTWNAAFKFPGGSAPTIASFPAVIPFYVQSSSVLLMGNVTEGIA